MTLREVKIGGTVTVKKLTGEGAVKRRIMDMGLTKGTSVTVRKVAAGRPYRSNCPRLRAVDPQGRRGNGRGRVIGCIFCT